MSEEKRNGAIRLFGALSGVDEKYLAECEKESVRQKDSASEKTVIYTRFAGLSRKYGKAVAAVFALCVLGAAYVGVQSLGNLRMGSAGPQSADKIQINEAAVMPSSVALQEAEEGVKPDLYAYLPKVWPGDGDAVGGSGNDKSAAVTESAISEMRDNANDSTNSGTSNGSGMTAGASGEEAAELGQTEAEIADEAADGVLVVQRDTFRLTIRAVEPETADAFGYTSHPEMMQDYLQSAREYKYGMEIYSAEEFDRSCVEEQLGTGTDAGTASFGVLYSENDRYVLVEFEGSGTVDEVWEMFESIRR